MSTLEDLHHTSLKGYEPANIAHLYRTRGHAWFADKDPGATTISNVTVIYTGARGHRKSHPAVCGTSDENGLLLTLRHTFQDAEQLLEREAPLALWALVALLGCAWGWVGLKQLRWLLRKRRMVRYTRQLEDDGVEMAYDDEVNHSGLHIPNSRASVPESSGPESVRDTPGGGDAPGSTPRVANNLEMIQQIAQFNADIDDQFRSFDGRRASESRRQGT